LDRLFEISRFNQMRGTNLLDLLVGRWGILADKEFSP
jgi:hypothetical protein